VQALPQLLALVVISAYLLCRCAYYHRRNTQDWASIQAKLRPGTGRWASFHNARILMEMADFAERNGSGLPDADMLISLRKDAMQIRLSALGLGQLAAQPIR